MQCPYCGNQHPDNAQFCPVTGKTLIAPRQTPRGFFVGVGIFSISLMAVSLYMILLNGGWFENSTPPSASTETALPTSTRTPTATITPTPTTTSIPTATPVITWSKSIVESDNNNPAFFLSMDISSNGKYYLAYFLDRTDDLMVVEGNGNSWKPLRNLSQLNKEGRSVGFYVNLDIGDGELPYLAYLIYDRGMGRGAYPTSNGTWSTATIGQNLDILDMRVAMDSKSIPHFAILSKNGEIFYRSANTDLITVDTGVLSPTSIKVASNYYPVTLAVDSSQHPYICFSKLGKLQCKYNLGNSWILTNVTENGIYPSLQIDESDNLHLAYYDYKEKSLKYAFQPEGSSKWSINIVDATGNVGVYPSLKVDTNNLVHISYYDVDNTSLKYAIGRLGGWSVYTIDNDGNVGLTSSLVIDPQDNPAIGYYDSERRRIYFIVGHQK